MCIHQMFFGHSPPHMEGMNQSSHDYNVHNRHCRPHLGAARMFKRLQSQAHDYNCTTDTAAHTTPGSSAHVQASALASSVANCWAEAPIKIARMTLTIKLDGNWSSFQLANSTPPLSVTDSAIAPSARMLTCACFFNLLWQFEEQNSSAFAARSNHANRIALMWNLDLAIVMQLRMAIAF